MRPIKSSVPISSVRSLLLGRPLAGPSPTIGGPRGDTSPLAVEIAVMTQAYLQDQAAIHGYLAAQNQAAEVAAQARAQAAAAVRYTPAAITNTTPSGTTSITGSSAVWSCIIQHESGGNPSAVNASSGAGGLYQFLPSTWHGIGMSGLPENYSAADQTAAAQRLQAQQGWSPWYGDGCTPGG